MKVYNTNLLNNKQRFSIAFLVGIICAIICAFLYALIESMLSWHIPLLYVAMAYTVSSAIKKYGRGVQPKFSAMGVGCFILSVVLGYLFYYTMTLGFAFDLIPFYFKMMIRTIATFDIRGIIEMLCFAYAVYLAYYNSRIL